jgi:hypothetical protein
MLLTALLFPLLTKAAAVPQLIAQDDTVRPVKGVNVPVRFCMFISIHFLTSF